MACEYHNHIQQQKKAAVPMQFGNVSLFFKKFPHSHDGAWNTFLTVLLDIVIAYIFV